MYDARSPGRALFYLTRRLIGHLKKTPTPQAPSLTQTPHEVERLEPRIVLTASFGGAEQILGADAEHTLDTSGLWQSIDDLQMTNAETVSALSLSASKSFTLDHNLLATRLAATPVEFSGAAGNVITLPSPAGGFDQFAIWESAIMAPELAAKFPTIETFAGRGIDDPNGIESVWT